VIAATHDDHYFHLASRVLKMEDGQLLPHFPPGRERLSETAS
jgi:ABC-type siderophore export system fused ATPase/permease subunit